MQAAQATFISSTFWTERIGPSAALATLDAMAEEDAPARIDALGLDVRRRWVDLAASTGLALEVGGLPALGGFSVPGLEPIAVKTFVTQELLAAGFLAGTALYASIAHDEPVLDGYLERLAAIFHFLGQCKSTDDLLVRLTSGVAQKGFQRLA